MTENTCSFNEDQERHSTMSLIECGDAYCDGNIDQHGPDHSDFGAWFDCYNDFSTTDRQFLKISIDQRKDGAGTRRTVNYCNIPAVFIDRSKLGRARCIKLCQSQGQEVDRHPDCDLTSRPSTGQKCHHESATGDNKEKVIPENKMKWSSDKNPKKPCSVEDLEGPICIRPACCVKSYQNSGDVSPTPDPSHQTSRMKKHSLFRSPANVNLVSWNQAFRHRGVKKKVTSDVMKDISLSTHKNNIVWCRKWPDPPSGQCRNKLKSPGGSGREGKDMNKAMPVFTETGRGSGCQRVEQLHRAVVSPFTKRFQTPIFWHGHLRSRPPKFSDRYTTLPRSAPPQTLLIESSRRMYFNKAIDKPWM
ncbi:uncharacterized protein LOC121678297 [Alosa sapidissima]|uniref:uncharacterized protein LOC121678297 n=1 Tax=Alosa sapidissima TaxID=34773 RepID=UPI001C0854A4|nr:uncharacterized protein LOC121678297 [Alosa sapidissima]